MKKLGVLGCALLIMLSGCSLTSTSVDKHEKNDKPAKVVQKKEKAQEKTIPVSKGKDKENVEISETKNQNVNNVPVRYVVDSKTWSIKPIVPDAPKNVVLLTIDDAPDQHALEMAKTLKELNASAIFFLNGHFLTTDVKKETVKTLVKMGFMLGDHTYSHAYLPNLSPTNQEKEIMSTYDQIKEMTGEAPHFFRAPNGANTDISRRLSEENHMVLMNWSYGYDWNKQYENKEAITKIMVNSEYLHDGAILLMHDRPWTALALKDIVVGLRNKGYIILDPHALQLSH